MDLLHFCQMLCQSICSHCLSMVNQCGSLLGQQNRQTRNDACSKCMSTWPGRVQKVCKDLKTNFSVRKWDHTSMIDVILPVFFDTSLLAKLQPRPVNREMNLQLRTITASFFQLSSGKDTFSLVTLVSWCLLMLTRVYDIKKSSEPFFRSIFVCICFKAPFRFMFCVFSEVKSSMHRSSIASLQPSRSQREAKDAATTPSTCVWKPISQYMPMHLNQYNLCKYRDCLDPSFRFWWRIAFWHHGGSLAPCVSSTFNIHLQNSITRTVAIARLPNIHNVGSFAWTHVQRLLLAHTPTPGGSKGPVRNAAMHSDA